MALNEEVAPRPGLAPNKIESLFLLLYKTRKMNNGSSEHHIPTEIFMLIMSFHTSNNYDWLDMISKYGSEVAEAARVQPILFSTYAWHTAPPGLKFLRPIIDNDNVVIFMSRFMRNNIIEMINGAVSIAISGAHCELECAPINLTNVVKLVAKYRPSIEELSLQEIDDIEDADLSKFTNLRKLVFKNTSRAPLCDINTHKLETLSYNVYPINRGEERIDQSFVALNNITLFADMLIHKDVAKQLVDIVIRVYWPKDHEECPEDYITAYDAVITHETFPRLQRIKYELVAPPHMYSRSVALDTIINKFGESTLGQLCRATRTKQTNRIMETEHYIYDVRYDLCLLSSVTIQKKVPRAPSNLHCEVITLSAK
jgi:hypothetical protein